MNLSLFGYLSIIAGCLSFMLWVNAEVRWHLVWRLLLGISTIILSVNIILMFYIMIDEIHEYPFSSVLYKLSLEVELGNTNFVYDSLINLKKEYHSKDIKFIYDLNSNLIKRDLERYENKLNKNTKNTINLSDKDDVK